MALASDVASGDTGVKPDHQIGGGLSADRRLLLVTLVAGAWTPFSHGSVMLERRVSERTVK